MEKQNVIQALAALAQETRLDIFRLLVQAGPAGLPAGAVGGELGLPPATLSFHLKELRTCGLISHRRDGRSVIYAAEYQAVNDMVGYLMDNCCRPPSRIAVAAGRREGLPDDDNRRIPS